MKNAIYSNICHNITYIYVFSGIFILLFQLKSHHYQIMFDSDD